MSSALRAWTHRRSLLTETARSFTRLRFPGRTSDTTRRKAAAFTLLELLVMIAIIAVLASLLLAVMGRVKESANRTKCLSNLRQLGLGILTYAGQNNYVLPGPVYRGIEYPDRGNMSENHLGKFIETHLNYRRKCGAARATTRRSTRIADGPST
ncbi:MAG: type II secretion system GspH family protein [Verrucomicrobiota bacterium]|nr:type II secretion system GspH family protein [Verrucomicrobiota bacterium]